ncbi:Putative HAUS augmin-like complex subunit 6 [Septoria linicola]|uniref:HAUS augmin-like complex subunit 6 n=1 Tax=Septoria linicola TaxID=215465 RepID=A0A9Q9EML4_9PEZI|nr:putative HAUS augmin-like complex subunit 6 [Septoria linicola]USW54573.1 Putative HAUS augmin-like complex subunit 6 [Septoria linicola]
MERPTTANSTTSTHKRTISKTIHGLNTTHQDLARGSTIANSHHVISLFIRNCRLLNLDRLPDWPSVTPSNLAQDARSRIRCAEWCLFQLFRRYDSATTQEKLQPFFPPLEPLQSINLRAALYRCLNELKKDGVLGRETVLRKSMLDDCQGDKFWELCLSFSGLVLRRVTVENKNRLSYEKPFAEKVGTRKNLNTRQRDSMLPLAIAHKAALANVLTEKERKKQTFDKLFDTFADKEADLRLRKVQVQEQAGSKRRRSPEGNAIQDVLEKTWVGSEDVRNALQNGDAAAGGDSLLTKSFNAVWEDNKANRLFTTDSADTGVLEDLENRTRQQKRRLQRWQSLHEKLLNSKVSTTKDTEVAAKSTQLRFDKHQNLTLRDMADNGRSHTPVRHKKQLSAAKYDDILNAMRDELRKKSANDLTSPTKPVQRVKRPEFKRQSISVDTTVRPSPEPHQRSNSQTSVPLRNMFGKRVSSRSRSYQQPKVINQREPIPFKAEIFSPLKTDRGGSASPSPRASLIASPVQESPIEDELETNVPQRQRQGSDTGVLASATPSRASSGRNSPLVPSRLSISESSSDSPTDLPSNHFLTSRNLDGAARTIRPSLADRTRMSMAFKSSELNDVSNTTTRHDPTNNEDNENENGARCDTLIASDETVTMLSSFQSAKPVLNLQERTRQSISLAPTHPPKKASHARSRTSQIYPVNQFETPEKPQPRRSTVTQFGREYLPREQHRDITPQEKLFEEDVEYTSIFKARPKLARSPKLSPFPDSGHGSMESGNDVSFADDDIALDSPLKGR